MENFSSKNFIFQLLTLSVFLVLLLPELMQDGMFLDGITYAAVSKNLANGLGRFWFPHYSKTIYNVFHEHPPLVFGIQSLFFKILGDSYLTERIYSFITAIVTGLLIRKIWNQEFKESQYKNISWLPVLFWIIIPVCFWSYKNNMLENTMSIFTLAAFYYAKNSILNKNNFQLKALAFGSVFLVAAFLCKGPVALFPLGTIFLFWLIKKEISFGKMIISSLLFLIFFVAIFSLLFQLVPGAFHSLENYFNIQVLKSLKGEREIAEGSRIYILARLFNELLILFILSALILIISYLKRSQFLIIKNGFQKDALFFTLVGISASLPIIISPKQMGYYLVPSLPFFAIAFAILILPAVFSFIKWIKTDSFGFKFCKISGFVLLAGILIFSFFKIGKTVRDKETLEDIYALRKIIPAGEIIGIQNDMCAEWGLIAYFSRYANISLDCSDNIKHQFKLVKKVGDDKFENNYEKINPELNGFILLKLKR